ncbi:MAG TPA: tetratricopeptide repeat protein [Planctomycetota bacterium]|nr:tetratricopeptide repeat protein [Planctomycetota bacterium]
MADRPSSSEQRREAINAPCRRRPWLILPAAMAAASLTALLGGCGVSESAATQNAYLASLNGLNIDSEVGREYEEVHVTPPLSVSPAVQETLDTAKKSGDWAAARARLQAIADENPQDPSAWYYLGRVLTDAKAYDESVKALTQAVALRSDLPELWLDLATADLNAGKRDDAYTAAHTAAAADPTSAPSLQRAARIFYQIGRYDAAEMALNTLTGLVPEDPSAWHDRGRNLAASGRANLATACFERSMTLYGKLEQPTPVQKRDYAEVLTDYGIVLQWDHSDTKAKLLFEQASSIDPNYAMAWYKLSQQQSIPRLKPLYDVDAAIRNANKAVALSDAKNDEFLHQLAKVYAMGGNLDRAVVAEEQASLLVKDKYTRTLQMLKKLQSDHSRVFDPDQF